MKQSLFIFLLFITSFGQMSPQITTKTYTGEFPVTINGGNFVPGVYYVYPSVKVLDVLRKATDTLSIEDIPRDIMVNDQAIDLLKYIFNIPLEDTSLDTNKPGYIIELFNDMMQDGVDMSFICFLDNVPHAFSFGDITYFYIGSEDPHTEKETIEAVATSMKTLVIDVLYRFFIIKEEGRELKVSPNTDFSPKGYITIKDRSTDYHVLKCPACEEYLGFTKKSPNK